MTEYVGEDYGDEQTSRGTRPGEGKNDGPATSGTHRGWGDPQPGESSGDLQPGPETGSGVEQDDD